MGKVQVGKNSKIFNLLAGGVQKMMEHCKAAKPSVTKMGSLRYR